jgi:hypothetical protein
MGVIATDNSEAMLRAVRSQPGRLQLDWSLGYAVLVDHGPLSFWEA